ncbi:MAG: Ig-like domain-containing protein [Pirellulales bacterium]
MLGHLRSYFRGSASVDRIIDCKLSCSRRLCLEALEDRRMLAAGGNEQLTNLFGFETDTAVDPNNPLIVATSQFNQVLISQDGGRNFGAPITVNAPLAGYLNNFGGDPTLSFDSQGNLYFGYLSNNGAPVNVNFTLAVFAAVINPVSGAILQNALIAAETNTVQHDKEWVASDHWAGSPFRDNAYMVWSQLGVNQILFSRTVDGGQNWSAPIQLDPGGQGFVWPSEVSVAPNGDVWVAWHTNTANTAGNLGGIVMRRSSDGGQTFGALITPFPNGTADINDNAPPNPVMVGNQSWMQGAVQPRILLDPVRPNNIYIISVDDPDNNYAAGDPADIVMARSTDDGATWTRSIISHGPANTIQTMPSAAIDEDGNLSVMWYDSRNGVASVGPDQITGNADDNLLLDLFATVSLDGGLTFSNDFQINEIPFDPDFGPPNDRFPPNQVFRIGEYNGHDADSGYAWVSWTANSGGNQDISFDVFSALSAFPDPFEENDTIATATFLGSPSFYTLDGTIHPSDSAADVDYYRYVAHSTGKLLLELGFFHEAGNLDLQVQDRFGNTIASSTSTDDNEQIVIPVVAGQSYYIRVNGVGGNTNHYTLEIENFAAPFPTFIDLAASSDTGMMNNDDITSDTTPTFFIQADLADFQNMGITLLNQATIDPNNDGVATDATDDGAGVYLSLINLATGALAQGFANPVGPTGILWSFTVPALAALTNGEYFVSSAVQIVDGQDTSAAPGTQRATGRAQLSDPFLLTIIEPGGDVADMVSADLIDASDTGMFNDDNVTNKMSPAFNGVAPVGSKVRLYANGELVGQTIAGSDTSDVGIGGVGGLGGAPDDGLGLWEITSEPLADNGYDITLEIEDAAGNVTIVDPIFNPDMPEIDIVIDTVEPNTPFLDLLDDTGRHDNDNITKDTTPGVSMTTTDPNVALAQLLFTDNFKFRIFDRFENSAQEVLIYDSAQDPAADAFMTPGDMFTAFTQLTRTLPFLTPVSAAIVGGALANGVHNLKLEVEDRAGNISHDFLLPITVDTIVPPVSFGLPTVASAIDGLAASSDSGVTTMPATYADRVTNDTTPTLWGRAEANSILRLYLDRNADGIIDLATDTFLGQTVALPFDGNDAYPEGFWEITSELDLNEIVGLPKDGLRRLLVTAEDVAGNPMPMNGTIAAGVDALQIFIDTQGPQVTGVTVNDLTAGEYDLFDPKPSETGPTPLVNSIQIAIRDLPNRLDQVGVINDFLYEALKEDIAANPGNYILIGDHVGIISIESIIVTNDPRTNGNPATATVVLNFFDPLPDDRYTLAISQNLVDPAGNNLDGESNAGEPQEDPTFPSGDGVPGGDFVARFTVDSRPEIGASIPQGITIDINGNFVWDPANAQVGNDATNVDLAFELAAFEDGELIAGGLSVHDLVVVGRFTAPGGNALPPRLFDQLASYGNYNGIFRWLIDFDSDGVVYGNGDPDGVNDLIVNQGTLPGFNSTARAGAIPVAGDFDRNDANGDEIGLYYAGTWALDTNHDFILDRVFTGNLLGAPIVGNFDGDDDGFDDLAVFNNNQFFFDLSFNPLVHTTANSDTTIIWGFPGVTDRPVAADMDQDGIDDIGLWVPRNGPQPPQIIAEWYFLLSGDFEPTPEDAIDNRLRITGQVNTLNHPFSPVPFGTDLFAEFGDELALPIVGNFDPPVASGATVPHDGMEGDYNHDLTVDMADHSTWKATFGSTTNMAADGNNDGRINIADYTVWRDRMGQSSGTSSASASAESTSAALSEEFNDSFVPLTESTFSPVAYFVPDTSRSLTKSPAPYSFAAPVTPDSDKLLLLEAVWSEPVEDDTSSATDGWAEESDDDSDYGIQSLDDAFAAIL